MKNVTIFFLFLFLMIITKNAEAIDLDQYTRDFLLANQNEREDQITKLGFKLYVVDDQNPYVKQHFSANTMGLFLGNLENSKGLILVRSLNDTWTLVHEYQHGLYHLTKKHFDEAEEYEKLENAKEDLVEIIEALNASRNDKNEKLNLLKSSLQIYMEKMILFLREFELEEVKIETNLQKIYESKKIFAEILGNEAYQASFNYKNKNCQRIKNRLKELEILKMTIAEHLTNTDSIYSDVGLISFKNDLELYCEKPKGISAVPIL